MRTMVLEFAQSVLDYGIVVDNFPLLYTIHAEAFCSSDGSLVRQAPGVVFYDDVKILSSFANLTRLDSR